MRLRGISVRSAGEALPGSSPVSSDNCHTSRFFSLAAHRMSELGLHCAVRDSGVDLNSRSGSSAGLRNVAEGRVHPGRSGRHVSS
eukprot:1275894-Rhodomonas_salina.2